MVVNTSMFAKVEHLLHFLVSVTVATFSGMTVFFFRFCSGMTVEARRGNVVC